RCMSSPSSSLLFPFTTLFRSMSVDDLLKGVALASANDASVALAEFIAGSEERFVAMMNQKAKELGLKDTHFKNTNGLPEEGHVRSEEHTSDSSHVTISYAVFC